MSLFKSFGILRRCLNTAASNSKPILNGQPEAVSQSINHGQTILERLVDRAKALTPAQFTVAEASIFMVMALTIDYLIDESLTKAHLAELRRKSLEDVDRKAEEFYCRRIEKLKLQEEEVNKEIKLLMEELKTLEIINN